MPDPSWVLEAAPWTRWNRSKRWGSSCSGMPMPVSDTVRTAAPSASRSRTVTPPSKVNLNAFDTRLSTIFAHCSWST